MSFVIQKPIDGESMYIKDESLAFTDNMQEALAFPTKEAANNFKKSNTFEGHVIPL